ncbi:MAG: S-adenosylmethionine--2-demethylmenaquinone methyltransferase, partial [Corynebacterium sp.]|nr:S-adenosylmethionine--2-demethylmenaquinone methyltransferase [Corynebacterium sp.]
AIGTNPRKSAKDGLGVVEASLTFGGVTFIPGHTLYADSDGIILMPEPLMN